MLELSEMIRALRQELKAATEDGRGEELRFELGPVEVEATVAVERSAEGGGRVRFMVVEADGRGAYAKSQTQRITLTLFPKTAGRHGELESPHISGDALRGER